MSALEWFLICVGAIVVVCELLRRFTKWEAEQIRLSHERRKAAGWRDDLSWSENMTLNHFRHEKRFREACRELDK